MSELTHTDLLAALPHALATTDLPLPRTTGKVRDVYRDGDTLLLVATDRVSAFDRVLGLIPYRGQVLTQLAAWWFRQTADIIANHLRDMPDPNVLRVQATAPLPVEVIVRGYITGVTSTSLWTLYAQGARTPYGIALPDGLQRNDQLPTPIITPTTKAAPGAHDERLTVPELLAHGLVSPQHWQTIATAALALFARGQQVARQAGLLLVDTKYEFGLHDGEPMLIDEIHTPDSSRYWLADSYAANPQHPEHLDKEWLRQWYVAQGYRGDGEPPALPTDVAATLAARYITAYERLTGEPFVPAPYPAPARIAAAVTY